ncbi:MAG: hypothetical protein RLZZ399_1315 [Verrucomicrobiota bacterium]|jgi:hypothetical protein
MRLSSLLLLLTLTLSGSTEAFASYSLFDSSNARSLKPEERSWFGPQSGNFRYDKRMIEAAAIAAERARASSTYSCWRYVKNALMEARLIDRYPKTRYAKEAGAELQTEFGFRKISVSDPYKAPTGSILVYGGPGAGHVEFRSKDGFVSDFVSLKPSPRPLIGVYVKPRS